MDTQGGPDTRESPARGAGSRVAFTGALTFTLPTRPDAFRTTLSTFSLLSVFLGILGGPLLLLVFLPNVFVVGSLLHPPLALVFVHLKGALKRLGGLNEAPNAGLGLGKSTHGLEPWNLAGHHRQAA